MIKSGLVMSRYFTNTYENIKQRNEQKNKTQNLLNITATRIYEEFKKLLKKAGLDNQKFTLHCLRHTIATQLLDGGMELEKVRDFLGHEYLGTTQIYTRVNYGNRKLFTK